MNTKIVREYIDLYKSDFETIHYQELYKWKAIQHFQEHWDIDAKDFVGMLSDSLAKTKNLLASGNYLARRMVKKVGFRAPEEMRALFKVLFDEDKSLDERVTFFRDEFIELKNKYTDSVNHFQDDRAILVYLCLRYPDTYYLYKYQMFKEFTSMIDYHYRPVGGKFINVLEYQSLCDHLKSILVQDNELLKMHHDRLSEDCYQDPAYNILTQDFVYACVRHLPQIEMQETKEQDWEVSEGAIDDLVINGDEESLTGRQVDHDRRQQRNSRIGKLGEQFVIQYELQKLKQGGIRNYESKVEHASVVQGDGLGYDIESRDLNGKRMFIEVKTTTGGLNAPFYITRNELRRSIQDANQFYLYRVYDFDPERQWGKIKVFKGSLESLCVLPVNYLIKLTR